MARSKRSDALPQSVCALLHALANGTLAQRSRRAASAAFRGREGAAERHCTFERLRGQPLIALGMSSATPSKFRRARH